MNREFVPYKIALALKELGFDEPCFAMYNNWGTLFIEEEPEPSEKELLAPIYQQVFRWFRKKYGINVVIDRVTINEWTYTGYDFNLPKVKEISEEGLWDTHEEAELACLDKLIEIVKKQII